MKKIYSLLLMLIVLSMSFVSYAGNIPDELLGNNDALLYFARVVTYKPDEKIPHMEIEVTDKIKGDVSKNSKFLYLYPQIMGDFEIIPGNVYLFAYINEENAYVYETSSQNTENLKLLHVSGSVHEKLQSYINNGEFKKAEEERKCITLSEFMELDKERKCTVTYVDTEKEYAVDKEMFFRLADEIILTDIDNEPIEHIKGIYINVLYENEPHDSVINHKYAYLSDDLKFDRYSMYMSRLPVGDYSISEEDANKLYALIDGENILKANQEITSKTEISLIVSVILIFVLAFAFGYVTVKKKRKDDYK